MYNNSRFADSGYLSRTPTPPTPLRLPSPQSAPVRQDNDENSTDMNGSLTHRPTFAPDVDAKIVEKPVVESKARLPYVKRTRIQYTLQQVSFLEKSIINTDMRIV